MSRIVAAAPPLSEEQKRRFRAIAATPARVREHDDEEERIEQGSP